MSDELWAVQIDPPVLLPGRSAAVSLTYSPDRDHDGRAVRAVLRCQERYRYDRTEMSGTTTRTVTHTDTSELARIEVDLAGAQHFVRGQPVTWHATFDVPGLGPATFEGDALRCDWSIEANVDIPMGVDPRHVQPVRVAQPMALLRAGVIDSGQYGLFAEAPVNVDAHPAQIKLDPVPISLQSAFDGLFTLETGEPIEVKEVRLELRVLAQVTESGGHHEEFVAWHGALQTTPGPFGGPLAEHPFHADASGAWLPSIDLPHGRARAELHVILARDWATDIHYQREIAVASTTEL